MSDESDWAAEELSIRAGRAVAPDAERPLRALDDEALAAMAGERDPDVLEDLGDGITLRRTKRRSTARRRLEGEPEPASLDETTEPESEPAPDVPRETLPEPPRPPRKPKPPATPPVRASARIPLGSGLSQLIGTIGMGLAVTGRDPGVGAALQFEAPVAGPKLDGLIAGTPLDKLAQPLARGGAKAKDLGAILALPLLVGLCERRPGLLQVPVVRQIGQALVVEMAIELVQSETAAQERLKAVAELDPKVAALAAEMSALFFPDPSAGAGEPEPAPAD